MKVELKRKNKAFHFEATGSLSNGPVVNMDCSPKIGGEGKGARPMELLLMSIGGCASIDFGLILKKQRQELMDVTIVVSGERAEDVPKQFNTIHMDFILKGDLDKEKVEKAIKLTVEKYCSVIKSLDPDIPVTYDYSVES